MSAPVAVETVENAITRIDDESKVEQIAEAHQRLKYYLGHGRALERKFKELCIAWIEKHGDISYTLNERGAKMILTVGHRKDTKCRDLKATIERLVEVCGGDWDLFVTCLSSNALKHGESRKRFKEAGRPELFDECFEVEEVTTLKDGSPVEPDLIEIDTTWMK